MDRARTVARFVVGLCVLVLFSGIAAAHPVRHPKLDRLHLTKDRLTLQIEYVVPDPSESALLFRLFDRDRSETLEEREQLALREHLFRLASAFVAIELDGKPLSLRRHAIELLPARRNEPLAVTLTLVAEVTLRSQPQVLRISDRHKDRLVSVPLRVTTEGIRITTPLAPQPILGPDQSLALGLVLLPVAQ